MSHEGRGRKPSLRVVAVPGKGRGLVAGRRFACGEVVESAPVLVIPAREWELVQSTVVGRYCFDWNEGTGSVAVALSRASFLNHSYAPNVTSEKHLGSRLIVFVALRDVEAGEELTLNYNGDPGCRASVGFAVR